MIKNITRGSIIFELEGKVIDVQGEALLPGYGSTDFVIFANSIQKWAPPFESELIDNNTKEKILAALLSEMKQRGLVAEIE